MLVAEVILPLPLDKTFHYAVPSEYHGPIGFWDARLGAIWKAERIYCTCCAHFGNRGRSLTKISYQCTG